MNNIQVLHNRIIELEVSDILIDQSLNTRGPVDTESQSFKELLETVGKIGLLHNVGVFPIKDEITGNYTTGPNGENYCLIFGFRRITACKKLEIKHVPALIKCVDKLEALEINLAENIGREDISTYNRAKGFLSLKTSGREIIEIADKVGCSEGYVNLLVEIMENVHPSILKVFENNDSAEVIKDLRILITLGEKRDLEIKHKLQMDWWKNKYENVSSGMERKEEKICSGNSRLDDKSRDSTRTLNRNQIKKILREAENPCCIERIAAILGN